MGIFKKKALVAPVRYYIPDDKVKEYWTRFEGCQGPSARMERLGFWQWIAEMWPDVRDGIWITGGDSILRPWIEKEEGN